MPIPVPRKGEAKSDFVSRCISVIYDEYKDTKGQPAAICYTQWKNHKAKASMVISAAGEEYLDGPFSGQADNTDPINDNGKNPPASPNPAPPAAQPIQKAPPTSAQPSSDDDTKVSPDPQDTDGPGTNDESYPGYVGGCPTMARQVDPKPLSNPEGGALAPNPDNATMSPKVGVKENADSLDDHSAKPDVNDLNWYMGKRLTFKVDTKTGLAKWPLKFDKIEDDFDRPNKVTDPNAEPQHKDNEDADRVAKDEKPYETGTPI